MIRVLVVDDQPLIRQAVSAILDADSRLVVCGEAAGGVAAIAQARLLSPDMVVMDIRMPDGDGITATAQICADQQLSDTRVLVLTTFDDDENVFAALRAGASGFIGKGAEPEEIVAAVCAVHAGDALLSQAATRALIRRAVVASESELTSDASVLRRTRDAAQQLGVLTERERAVLMLVGQGLSNAEIAQRWVISPHTAKTHVNRIMSKLHAHDRAQLVIIAYETGVITAGVTPE